MRKGAFVINYNVEFLIIKVKVIMIIYVIQCRYDNIGEHKSQRERESYNDMMKLQGQIITCTIM